jgi:hypothetical protein
MTDDETCAYARCDRPPEVTVHFEDTDEEYGYCAVHAEGALESFDTATQTEKKA